MIATCLLKALKSLKSSLVVSNAAPTTAPNTGLRKAKKRGRNSIESLVESNTAPTTVTKKAKVTQVVSSGEHVVPASQDLVIDKPTFEIPEVTRKNKNVLKGQTFVSTGTFPELGGGRGISLGKENPSNDRTLVERTNHICKERNVFLIEGKDKGNKKSQKAHKWKILKMSLHDLKLYILGDTRRVM